MIIISKGEMLTGTAILVANRGNFDFVKADVLYNKLKRLENRSTVSVAQSLGMCRQYQTNSVLNKDFSISKRCGNPIKQIVGVDFYEYDFNNYFCISNQKINYTPTEYWISSKGENLKNANNLAFLYLKNTNLLWTFSQDYDLSSIATLKLFTKNPYVFIFGKSNYNSGVRLNLAYILNGELHMLDESAMHPTRSNFVLDLANLGMIKLKQLNGRTGKLEDRVSEKDTIYTPLNELQKAFTRYYKSQKLVSYDCEVIVTSKETNFYVTIYNKFMNNEVTYTIPVR